MKKTVLILIAVVIVFSFVGCSDETNETVEESIELEAEETEEASKETETEEAVAEEEDEESIEETTERVISEELDISEEVVEGDYSEYLDLEVLPGENYARDLSHKALTEDEDIDLSKEDYTISNDDFYLRTDANKDIGSEYFDLENIFYGTLNDVIKGYTDDNRIFKEDPLEAGVFNNNIYHIFHNVVYYLKLPNTEVDMHNTIQERRKKAKEFVETYIKENNLDKENSEHVSEAYDKAYLEFPFNKPVINKDDLDKKPVIAMSGVVGYDNSEEDKTLTVYYKDNKIYNGMTRKEVVDIIGKPGIESKVIEEYFGHTSNEIAYQVEDFKLGLPLTKGEVYDNAVLHFGFNKETDLLDYVGLRLE